MLMAPKGLEYWDTDVNGNSYIHNDAPNWAKKEFEEYQTMLKSTELPKKDGNIIQL